MFKINNEASLRHFDENGYLFVDKSPILSAGVLEYYGQELIDGGLPEIDGQSLVGDKLYKVFVSEEELEKAKKSFELLPLVNGHEWLGEDGEDAKDYQEGTTGEGAFIEDGLLYVPLKFTGNGIVDDIRSGEKIELSASYKNKLTRADSQEYDFVATDLQGNHIALVNRGRCGPSVRVLNMEKTNMTKEVKLQNEVKLVIDGKEIDLGEFFKQEQEEDAHEDTGSITDTENVDKRKLIDEVGSFLKEKGLSDEDIRFVIGKMEKDAYEPSEESDVDNEDPKEEDEDAKEDETEVKNEEEKDMGCRSQNYDAIYSKISEAISKKMKAEEEARVCAYNSARNICGDFNFIGMDERAILVKALNHAGIEVENESVAELKAMLKACSQTAKIDNGFSYGVSSDVEEIESNI